VHGHDDVGLVGYDVRSLAGEAGEATDGGHFVAHDDRASLLGNCPERFHDGCCTS